MIGAKRVWWLALLVVALACVATVWFGRPAYCKFKEARSVRQARTYIGKGDYRSANLSLRIALALNNSNVLATSMMAEMFDKVQSPAAVGWHRRLCELEPALSNRVNFAACALRFEKPPFPITTQTLKEIEKEGQANTAFHVVASRLALKLHQGGDAEEHLEAACQLEPTNRLYQLNLATVRLQSADTNVAESARLDLAALASEPLVGQAACRSLTSDCLTRHELVGAQTYSQRLDTNGNAILDDHLLRLAVLNEAKDLEFTAALTKLRQNCATNRLLVAQMLSWMNTHGLARAGLDWSASLPSVTRNALPVPLAETDCYMSLKDWSGLENRLLGQRWDEQEFLRLALLARALREQGRQETSAVNWRLAVSGTSGRTESMTALVHLAVGWGWREEARDLLWDIIARAPAHEWALQMLMRDYMSSEDTEGLYRVNQAVLARHPDSVEAKNNVATLGLLLNRDVERANALARDVYEGAGSNVTLASTYAFALHTQGKTVEGLKLMQMFPEQELMRPEVATYYAVLLSASGDAQRAEPYIAAAEKGRPLPEERKLLAQARKTE